MKYRINSTFFSTFIGAILGGLFVLYVPSALAQISGSSGPQINPSVDAPEAPSVTVSTLLNYQGKLVDPVTNFAKADGSYPMTFLIYNSPSSGSLLWSEVQSVQVKNGLFFVQLGSATPIPGSIFTGQDLWLAVAVGSDPEATPRQLLTSVAYAQLSEKSNFAQNAANFNGLSITNFYKTFSGTQVTQNTPLAAGGNEYWFTFGWSSSYMMVWRAVPTTNGGKVKLDVEIEYNLTNNTYTYYLRVTNTGTAATTYQLKYDAFYH